MDHKILLPNSNYIHLFEIPSNRDGDEGRPDPLLERNILSDVGLPVISRNYDP